MSKESRKESVLGVGERWCWWCLLALSGVWFVFWCVEMHTALVQGGLGMVCLGWWLGGWWSRRSLRGVRAFVVGVLLIVLCLEGGWWFRAHMGWMRRARWPQEWAWLGGVAIWSVLAGLFWWRRPWCVETQEQAVSLRGSLWGAWLAWWGVWVLFWERANNGCTGVSTWFSWTLFGAGCLGLVAGGCLFWGMRRVGE